MAKPATAKGDDGVEVCFVGSGFAAMGHPSLRPFSYYFLARASI
jgi:hypothetical protein